MTSDLLTRPAVEPSDHLSPDIRWLFEPLDPQECGGKAARLSQLRALDIDVPDGFVIPAATFDRFFGRDANAGRLSRVLDVSSDLASESEELSRLVLNLTLPESLCGDLEAAVRRLGSGPFIARSSACGEDGAHASFAGQFDSIPDLHTTRDLEQAILQVLASRWSHRALAYARATGAALAGMSVLIQRQVEARWSGVLFTQAPHSRGALLVEYCTGRANALVSGHINPGRVYIQRADGSWTHDCLPDGCPAPAAVDDAALAALRRTALRIEDGLGGPQDIEWAMDHAGRLWIVQARPITVPASTDGSVASTDVVPWVVWSNANVNENFPDPISPFLYSIARDGYYHYFRNLGRSFGLGRRRLAAMEEPLRQIIGVHGARMYYNLTSIHAVLRSAPCGHLLAATFDQFVGAEATDTVAAVPFGIGSRVTTAFELARVAAQTTWQYLFLGSRVARFEQRVDAYANRTHPSRLEQRTLEELRNDLQAFVDIRRHRWNDAALADAGSMVCYGLLQRALARAFPEPERQSLHNALLKGLPNLVSGRPALALWDLASQVRRDPALQDLFATFDDPGVVHELNNRAAFADFARAFSQFQEEWGFRCSGELMLTQPNFQEDATPLVALIRGYLTSGTESPSAILERQTRARIAQTTRLRQDLRGRRVAGAVPAWVQGPLIMRLVAWTQTCVGLRERARLKQALLYSRLRHILLAIGRRLVQQGVFARADDVFMLTREEVNELLAGSAMFPATIPALVDVRRRAHIEITKTTPPDRLALPRGGYLSRDESQAGDHGRDHVPGARLKGLGASSGVARGRAVVLQDVREAGRLQAGDVLVTRQTDPGWGPVFPLIAGLVIERGGMLSHGAIIAREFGIPAVVGVQHATTRIVTGQYVVVNADRGVVTIEGES